MRFETVSNNIEAEYKERLTMTNRKLSWGIKYLDDALEGIFANDLVLLGAPPGVGKTQLCLNIALTNLLDEKRVHYIALEAHLYEIERRLNYMEFANRFFSNKDRPRIEGSMNFKSWVLGKNREATQSIEDETNAYCKKAFSSFFTLYKDRKFGVKDLIEHVNYAADDTDLIIVDHVHYFDWDDESDNQAIKQIVHTARDLTQETGKPIILVAHLRKRDRGTKELVPGMEEFHGSSELAKVATKCVTLAPGGVTDDGKYVTYFRAAKDRLDNGPSRYVGRTSFNPKKGGYDSEYRIGWSNAEKFGELTRAQYPEWATRPPESSHSAYVSPTGEPSNIIKPGGAYPPKRVHIPD